jgi:hypothetical protein
MPHATSKEMMETVSKHPVNHLDDKKTAGCWYCQKQLMLLLELELYLKQSQIYDEEISSQLIKQHSEQVRA